METTVDEDLGIEAYDDERYDATRRMAEFAVWLRATINVKHDECLATLRDIIYDI